MNENTTIEKLEELLNNMDIAIESAKDYYDEHGYMFNDSVKDMLDIWENERDSLEEVILKLDS